MRLAIVLRLLAGASYLDVMMCFHVGSSTVHEIFHGTCIQVMRVLKLPGISMTFPEFNKFSKKCKHSRSPPSQFSGCIGASDRISIQSRKPEGYENRTLFYCRKGFYALQVLDLVDVSYPFRSYSARCIDSRHDAVAHSVTGLGRFLEGHGLGR